MRVEKVRKAQLELSSSPEGGGANHVCPQCGGPAEVETFWSTSPNRPGLKILKRQVFCGKRPRRGFRGRPSSSFPVVLEEIGCEPIYQEPVPPARKLHLSIVKLEVPAQSESEVPPISSN